MKVFDYFTIGNLDVYIEPISACYWEDVNELAELFNAVENVGWRLPTLDELKFLHENKFAVKFKMDDFWFFKEDAPYRIYTEELGVWIVKPTCKFPAILVKTTVVN